MNARHSVFAVVILALLSTGTVSFAKPYISIKSLRGHTAEVVCAADENSRLTGALFNNDGILVEAKSRQICGTEDVSIVFDNSTDQYDLRFFLWTESMTALTQPVERNALGLSCDAMAADGVYTITDRGKTPVTVSFKNDVLNIDIDFDILVKHIPNGAAVVGVIPYSNTIRGRGAGLCGADDEDAQYLPSENIPEPPFQLVNTADFKNRWIHISMKYRDGKANISYTDTEDGTVYVDNQKLNITAEVGATLPINKLSFGLLYAGSVSLKPSSDAEFCIKNLSITRQ